MISIHKKSTIKKLLTIKSDFKELERRTNLMKKLTSLRKDLHSIENINNIIDGNVKSQNCQDLIAKYLLENKSSGFFVEFGADDGIENSNTYLFSRTLNWTGILIEPNKNRFKLLERNRPKDRCCNRLIYKSTGDVLEFIEAGQLSTISEFESKDFMSKERKNNITNKYLLKSISLTDFLLEAEAPFNIDFLSIDTEGSEFEILNTFDFNLFNIKLICFEHNNSENRAKIKRLLEINGYNEVLEFAMGVDSFFIRN